MAHFAEVDKGMVLRVIVADQSFIDSGSVGKPSRWIACSYNTVGGVHCFGGVPLRKNYPGPGWMYDEARDAFIPRKPFPSWTLNEESCLWEPPIPKPEGKCIWDEASGEWVLSA